MATQMLASRSQTAGLCASTKRAPAPARRSTITFASADGASRRSALTWLTAATVGVLGVKSVEAASRPAFDTAGLFDFGKGGGGGGTGIDGNEGRSKGAQAKQADQRQLDLNKKRPQTPETSAGLGSQGTKRQDLGPNKLIKSP